MTTQPLRTLVLGATGDLGGSLAMTLSRRGHRLVVHGHTHKDRLEALQATSAAEAMLVGDVTNESSVASMFETCGPIDGMAYCVGVNPVADRIADMSEEAWRRVIDVNLLGAFLCVKHAIPMLRNSPSPAIVLVSSIFGQQTPARRSAYGASKHGLTAIVQAVTREEGSWLRINAVSPGPIWSDNVREIFTRHATAAGLTMEEYVQSRISAIPARRFATLDECAKLIAFLLSPESTFIMGEDVRLTGGAIE